MDHYARDCPQASQRPKEWAKCLLEDTLALIGDESVEEALAAIGLDFVQEDAPSPGRPPRSKGRGPRHCGVRGTKGPRAGVHSDAGAA
ncbi:hypothetical protein CYMTET_14406 [Cymbomonas tetramitiformis]|uniref:Uncharacterized protein n=1 Tax=Cymbomonas tetramitiformis TaxID=36881 RepID=A0AAE0LA72_9CHLO|nr:hypothetical protein CYMTET_14406 [Cymbomonas tetramitiformis]